MRAGLYTGRRAAREPEPPGTPPFTRGIYADMYRGRPWTMRQYAGFATAEDRTRATATCSRRARRGFRSPSTCRPRSATTRTTRWRAGEVGRVGVAIDSLADMEALLDGIPLDPVSTSMTINAPGGDRCSRCTCSSAEEQGVARDRCGGRSRTTSSRSTSRAGPTSSRRARRCG